MKFRTSSKVSFDVLEKIKLEYENNKDLEEKGESSDDNNYENNMVMNILRLCLSNPIILKISLDLRF